MDLSAPLRIANRIKTEEKLGGLAPVGAISSRIEQTQVEDHVLAVIGRERLADGWLVEKGRHRGSHGGDYNRLLGIR